MKIQSKEFVIAAHDSGLALKRGAIIVYSIQTKDRMEHLTRQDKWNNQGLLLCDTFAARELDEVIRRNKDAD